MSQQHLLHLLLSLLTYAIVGLDETLIISQTYTVSPSNPHARIALRFPLPYREELSSVTWYRSNDIDTGLIQCNLTSAVTAVGRPAEYRKYECDVREEEGESDNLILSLVIKDVEISDEDTYLAHVELSPPTSIVTSYGVNAEFNVANDISIKLNEVRIVGSLSTVTCVAKGWKPAAQFLKLKKYGERSGSVEEVEMNVTETVIAGTTATIATYAFPVTNKDRGVTILCSAYSSVTGKDNPIQVSQVFTETQIYTPRVGDPCLWPPNTRSQCEREDEVGVGCLNGTCIALYNRFCTHDEQCGHQNESRLQCIDRKCQCDDRVFHLTSYKPYCEMLVGQLCGVGSPCTTTRTKCQDNACTCDLLKSKQTVVYSRGANYSMCKLFVGERCLLDSDCTSTGEGSSCVKSNCVCSTARSDKQCSSTVDESPDKAPAKQTRVTPVKSTKKMYNGVTCGTSCLLVLILLSFFFKKKRSKINTEVDTNLSPEEDNVDEDTLAEIENPDRNWEQVYRRNSKVQSMFAPKQSTLSVLSYTSVGATKRAGPDFGESSTSSLAKYIHDKVKKGKQEEPDDKGLPSTSSNSLPQFPQIHPTSTSNREPANIRKRSTAKSKQPNKLSPDSVTRVVYKGKSNNLTTNNKPIRSTLTHHSKVNKSTTSSRK